MTSLQQRPLPKDTPYEEVVAELVATEKALSEACADHLGNGRTVTYADLYGMGIARRCIAISAGFRAMVEQRNSVCALPLVRMQLDSVLRFYAGSFVSDHQEFCREVYFGKTINKFKSDEGRVMRDAYLRDRVAKTNPWITSVYEYTSGYIHFSNRHILEVLRKDDKGNITMAIGPADADREPSHFREPMRCLHHLNLILEFSLKDWFSRMCDPTGAVAPVQEYWSTQGNE